MRLLTSRLRALWALALLAVVALAGPATAQTSYLWAVDAAGTWNTTSANWYANGVPPLTTYTSAAQNIAQFGDVITASRTIGVQAGGVTAGQVQFLGGGTFFYTIGTASNPITLNNGAADAVISVSGGFVGTAAYAPSTGGETITGSTISYANNLSIVNNGAFGATDLTIASSIDRAAAGGGITVSGQGNTSISGVITANTTGGLTKTGSGTLNLGGANAFTGTVAVNGGVLSVAADSGFGAAANAVNINGGTVRFTSSTSPASRVFTVGASGGGIDVNAVTATFAATGQIAGTGALLLSTTNSSTGGSFVVTGANAGYTGTVTVGLPAAQLVGSVAGQRNFTTTTFTTLTLGSTTAATSGTLSAAAGIVVSNSSLLQITQPTAAITGRTGSAPITFNNGRFTYNTSTNSNTAVAETLGNVTASGMLTISGSAAAGGTGGTSVTIPTLTRVDNATLFIRGPLTGTGAIGGTPGTGPVNYKLGTAPALVGTSTTAGNTNLAVVPWAYGNVSTTGGTPNLPVTYDANGFRAINTSTEAVSAATSTAFLAAATDANVYATGNYTVALPAGGKTINSLTVPGNTGGVTFTGGNTLTVASGVVIANNYTITFSAAGLTAGANPLYLVHANDAIVVSGTGTISGSGGVVVSAFSTTYSVQFSNTVSNTFTGGLTLNGNTRFSFTANNQLGNDSGGLSAGAIAFGGGQMTYAPAAATTIGLTDGGVNRPVAVNASNGTIGTSVAGAVLQIPGTVSGAGQMQFGGASLGTSATGVVELTNTAANTYTGGTLVSTGVLRISNANQLGTGAVLLNGGTLQAAAGAAVSFAAPVTIALTASTLDTQTGSITLAGGLNGSGGISGSTALALTRTGATAAANTLTISGAGNYAGTITNNTGALVINGNGKLPELSGITLTATVPSATQPSVLTIDNSAVNLPDRTGRATNLALGNGGFAASNPTVNLVTNAAGSLFRFGSLAASGGTGTNANTAVVNLTDGGAGNNTIRFTSLTAVATNNTLRFVGTTNFGQLAAAGTHVFFDTAPALTFGAIPNVTFTGNDGSGNLVTNQPVTYDATYGLVLLQTTTGTFIDNINNVGAGTPTPVGTNYTTGGPTTANLGATIKTLTIAGHTVTLVPNVYAPQAGNATAPADTLVISGGTLISQSAASTITTGSAATVRFGPAGATTAAITTTTDLTVAAGVTLATTGGLTKTGAGLLTVNGTNNITGAYSLTGGTTTLPATAAASLTGSGALTLTGPLTLNGTDGGSTTFSGVLGGTATVATAAGFTNTQTLSGTNTFIGSVTVNGGTLIASNATALGNAANAVTVTGGGTLAVAATIANANPLSITGTGAAGRSGALDATATASFAGPITLAGNATIGTTTGTLTLSGGVSGTNRDLTVAGAGNVTLTTAALNLGTGNLTKTGAGTLTLPNVANTYVNTTATTGGTVAFAALSNLGTGTITLDGGGISYTGAASITLPAATVTANGATFGVTTSGAVGTLGAGLSTTGTVTKTGSGTVALAASSSNSIGTLSISAGTFDVNGNSLTVGALTGTGGTLALGGTAFTTTQTTTTTYSGVIAGAGGSVTMNGAGGVLVLAGTNTYTGGTTVTAGTVRLGTALGVPAGGTVAVAAGATLDVVGSFSNAAATAFGVVTLNGGTLLATTGSGDCYLGGITATGGTVTFTGTSNFWYRFTGGSLTTLASATTTTITGPTSGSRLQNETAAALPIVVAAGTTPSGIDLNVNALLSGSGTTATFSKQGSGVAQISFTGTTTGSFVVPAGTLLFGTGSTTTGTVGVTGGRVGGTGTINGAVTVTAGTLAPGPLGTTPGTLTSTNNTATAVSIGAGANLSYTISHADTSVAPVAGTTNDFLNAAGASAKLVLPAGSVTVILDGSAGTATPYTLGTPVSYTLATFAGGITNGGATFSVEQSLFTPTGGAGVSGYTYAVGTSGNNLVLTITPVPEPATVLGLAAAAAGAAGVWRRRRAA